MCSGSLGLWGMEAIAAPMICTKNESAAAIMPQLLADLPSYSNRVIQRARRLDRQEDTFSYIIEAGLPDFRPLPLKQQQFTSAAADTTEQLFFTTLDKQYINDIPVYLENHHWLLVTPSSKGWAVVHLFSIVNRREPGTILIPPRNTTHGSVGKAIQLWLRDYNAYCAN
ncbi:hypothetical protein [[Limnothrix rosea] IAM M-220]|uniref:hypothetical protein n=1 Tax=[Limnothrix rosea] IAM M-220 TaxID=454133 RepID=UPI000960D432|nr:hypothetical protein [[Limnothrix rosea] IAM M-220]OKH19591.1 hypothetical protein NIES208_01960 [[Limnothrix rosea] IAM M-220]